MAFFCFIQYLWYNLDIMEKEILPKSSEIFQQPEGLEVKYTEDSAKETLQTTPRTPTENIDDKDIESILNQPVIRPDSEVPSPDDNIRRPMAPDGEQSITENLVHVKIDKVGEAHNALEALTGE